MDIAERIGKMSYAVRKKVGCVIVKDDSIIAYGYNGTPAGWDNSCEVEEEYTEAIYQGQIQSVKTGKLVTRPEVLHSESNAIAKLSKSHESSKDAVMFCTLAPCLDCAKLIYQAGIKTLYYRSIYRDTSGLEFLRKGNVDVQQHPITL
jgi:dCMP deaminase